MTAPPGPLRSPTPIETSFKSSSRRGPRSGTIRSRRVPLQAGRRCAHSRGVALDPDERRTSRRPGSPPPAGPRQAPAARSTLRCTRLVLPLAAAQTALHGSLQRPRPRLSRGRAGPMAAADQDRSEHVGHREDTNHLPGSRARRNLTAGRPARAARAATADRAAAALAHAAAASRQRHGTWGDPAYELPILSGTFSAVKA